MCRKENNVSFNYNLLTVIIKLEAGEKRKKKWMAVDHDTFSSGFFFLSLIHFCTLDH